MHDSPIVLAEFSALSDPNVTNERAIHPTVRSWTRLVGMLGTLLLHGTAVLFVLHLSSRQPQPAVPAGVGTANLVVPAEALILLALTEGAKDARDLSANIAPLSSDLNRIHISSIDPAQPAALELASEDDSVMKSGVAREGDAAERALMVGRYSNQIRARIERTWVRPRSPIDEGLTSNARVLGDRNREDDIFACQVEIRQDGRGNVQEVLLLQCNGTEAWRHSLVVAINQSSPLPAPPVPEVFARAVRLGFEAHSYYADAPRDAYELEIEDGRQESSAKRAPTEVHVPQDPGWARTANVDQEAN